MLSIPETDDTDEDGASSERAVAVAPATCGELVQGVLDGRDFLITSPIDRFSTATVRRSGARGVVVDSSKDFSKELDRPYRILLTTLGGRFRYRLGDLVAFSSVEPLLLRVLGREREELNLGYERVPLHVLKAGLARACDETRSRMHNFFVCPTATSDVKPAHEWHIEFASPPESLDAFATALDRALHTLHDRYAFARKGDQFLSSPTLVNLPVGAIERYVLESREYGLGKFNSVYNERAKAGSVLDFMTRGEPSR